MIQISPSILASDFSELKSEIQKTEQAGATYLHIDVMDGIFVPNITIGPCVIQALRPHTKQIFDVHLMIADPDRYVADFANAGADIITIHFESCKDPLSVLQHIKALGKKAGLSIKPATKAKEIASLLPYCDMVLVMTVEPGFGGQKLILHTLDSVREVRTMLQKQKLQADIEVDGGITTENIGDAAAAGANIFVAGSSVFHAKDRTQAIANLKKSAENAIRQN